MMKVAEYGGALKMARTLEGISQEGVIGHDFSLRSLRRFENGQGNILFSSVCTATESLGVHLSEIALIAEHGTIVSCPLSLRELEDVGWYFKSARLKIVSNVQRASSTLLQSVCSMLFINDASFDWLQVFETAIVSLEELLRRSEWRYVSRICSRIREKVALNSERIPIGLFIKFEMIDCLASGRNNSEIVRIIGTARILKLDKLVPQLEQLVQSIRYEEYTC